MRLKLCILCVAVGIGFHGQSIATENVRMVLQWEHQSQFAGYYMALDKGFYQDENLDVTLLSGGPDVNPLQLVQDGQVDFCSTMLATVLQARLNGQTHSVLLSQIINRSNLALVAWKHGRDGTATIENPADLNWRKVTIWGLFDPPYHCFFSRHGIDAEIIPQYYTFSLFLHKGVDACSAMLYNEVHTINQCHILDDELTVFDFYKLGVNFPEDGIYCTQDTWKTRPAFCSAFTRASMKGWEYAQHHPEEALDVVMKRIDEAKLPTNRAHMKWMLDTILASVFPPNETEWIPGILSKSGYDEAVSIMGMEEQAAAYSDFVTQGAQNGLD